MARDVIEIIDGQGRRERVTAHRFETLKDDGWREYTAEDRRAAVAARRASTITPPTEEEIHRNGVLASVAGDPDAAAVAYEAEANREDPDEQLLAALEAIVDGHPADDPTPADEANPEHEEHTP